MHWSITALIIVVVAFGVGVWFQKAYPGTIPLIG